MRHVAEVAQRLHFIAAHLEEAGIRHDGSKLREPEKSCFDEYTPLLETTTYGSDEYKKYLREMDWALQHHYANNRHHPEHFGNGIRGMNLVDLVEMFCDWLAAADRHLDGNIRKSIDLNQKRFGYGDDLKSILHNTVDDLFDCKDTQDES